MIMLALMLAVVEQPKLRAGPRIRDEWSVSSLDRRMCYDTGVAKPCPPCPPKWNCPTNRYTQRDNRNKALFRAMQVRPLTDAELKEAEDAGQELAARYDGSNSWSFSPYNQAELDRAWLQQWKLRAAIAGSRP